MVKLSFKTHGLNLRGKMVLPPKKTKEKAKINKGYGQVGVPLSVPNDERVKPKASGASRLFVPDEVVNRYVPPLQAVDLYILAECRYEDPKEYTIPSLILAADRLTEWGLLEKNPEWKGHHYRRTEEGWLILVTWMKAGFLPDLDPKEHRQPLAFNPG